MKYKRIALLFNTLPGKEGRSWLLPRKTMCPNLERVVRSFITILPKAGLLTRLGCVQGLRWLGLLILMSFSGPFNLASGGFLAAPSLISNCLNPPFGTQHRSWRLESCLQEIGDQKNRLHAREPHRAPRGFITHHNQKSNSILKI